jgi:hypothetical protein
MVSRLAIAAVLLCGACIGSARAVELERIDNWAGSVGGGGAAVKYVWIEPGQAIACILTGDGRSDLDLRLDAVAPGGASLTLKRAATRSTDEKLFLLNDTSYRGYFRVVVENDGFRSSSFSLAIGVATP